MVVVDDNSTDGTLAAAQAAAAGDPRVRPSPSADRRGQNAVEMCSKYGQNAVKIRSNCGQNGPTVV